MTIVAASAGLSVINAIAEEVLWRGTFFDLIGDKKYLYILWSSLGFAIWHFAPLSVFGNHHPGGSISFVAVSFILGLLYSTVVSDSKSILWTCIAHIFFDFSGLGARLYF
jgi:membrane protease YdiL (CAAX protease family)